MDLTKPIEHDRYYHIFNQGVNGQNLFIKEADYLHFLELMQKYLSPIADVFAWVLLKNHFHVFIKTKGENEISYIDEKRINKRRYSPSRQFGHLFSSHTKYINKKYERRGNLFNRPFKRIAVEGDKYIKDLIYYIHNNPVHHGFADSIDDYKWSSYTTILSDKSTQLDRETVLYWFNSRETFVEFHNKDFEEKDFSSFTME